MHVNFIVGTRPEVIKLVTVEREFKKRGAQASTFAVNQQTALLDQTMMSLGWAPTTLIERSTTDFSLPSMLGGIVDALGKALRANRPDVVVVQGDTTTAFAGALAAFYERIPVAHVEAGLRTFRFDQPFPEEMHRACIDVFADYCFSPTSISTGHLQTMGVSKDRIWEVGNTVVDALQYSLTLKPSAAVQLLLASTGGTNNVGARRRVLVTCHRRENFADGIDAVCRAINRLLTQTDDLDFVVLLHPNPNVKAVMEKELTPGPRLLMHAPLPYLDFVHLLASAQLVLTDSGGVQEEATSLGIPFLVLREDTERPEGISGGTGLLVGTNADRVTHEVTSLMNSPEKYGEMSKPSAVFGDGKSSARIADVLLKIK